MLARVLAEMKERNVARKRFPLDSRALLDSLPGAPAMPPR